MKQNPFDKYLGKEDRVHIAVCRYVKLQYKGAKVHHSANEGKRTAFERYKIGLLGVSAGFPDVLIFWQGKVLALELKAEKNGKTSDLQKDWIAILNSHGIPARVCKGFDEARQFVDEHFTNN